MAAFVGGAALGAAFGELFALVREAITTIANFNSEFKLLHKTLSDIQPMIDEIVKLDRLLGRVPLNSNLAILLKKSLKLVIKCSKVGRLNFIDRHKYSRELKQLNDSLLRFFQIDEQAQISRDNREILWLLKQILASRNGNGRISRVLSIPGAPIHVVGFAKPLEEVKKILLRDDDDDALPPVVVVSARGGQGKTTLAKMICYDDQIIELFKENIFFVTFTAKPDVEVIVRSLINDMGFPEPHELPTAKDAIHELEKSVRRIEAAHVLLVLDDVWSESENLLEKFEFPVKGLKILVTSRSRFPKYERKTYNLSLLDEEDSMKLFRKLAFPNGNDRDMPEELMIKKVRGCRGFPLALEVVAGSLRRLPVEMWSEWSNSNNDLLHCLQGSVDVLDKLADSIKDCYYDLALFPEDERIPVTSLNDMWAALYNIDLGKTLLNLHELSLRNLVDLTSERRDNDISRIEVSSSEHYVMQHDTLRELAIHESDKVPIQERVRLNVDFSRDDLSDWPIDQPLNARVMSFSTDETFSSSWQNEQRPRPGKSNSWAPWFVIWFVLLFVTMFQSFGSFWKQKYLDHFHVKDMKFCSLKLPKLEALLLNIRSRNYPFPQFLEGMDQLKVLIVTNYGFHPTELRNFQLLCRLPSLRRIRLVHVSISSFDTSIIEMKNLQKISLSMCKIGNAFENCPHEIPIFKLPNLTEIEIDRCYDLKKLPSGLCALSLLTKLRITKCQELTELPDELGKMRNLEELRLYSCTKLSNLPDSIADLQKLSFLDISECIAIEVLPERIGKLHGLLRFNMRGCTGLKTLPESVKDLHELLEVVCDEEISCLWKNFDCELTNRKIKLVERENSIKCFHGE